MMMTTSVKFSPFEPKFLAVVFGTYSLMSSIRRMICNLNGKLNCASVVGNLKLVTVEVSLSARPIVCCHAVEVKGSVFRVLTSDFLSVYVTELFQQICS